jgi:hypothetical protein
MREDRVIYRYDKTTKEMVPCARSYGGEERALDAPIMVDRFRDNDKTADGIPINSRRKRRDYMRAMNVADFDDYKGVREKADERRRREAVGDFDHKRRREAIEKAWWISDEKRRGRTKF